MTTSIYPVPSICAEDQIADWFASLDECLRWNDRKRQKSLDDAPNEDYYVQSPKDTSFLDDRLAPGVGGGGVLPAGPPNPPFIPEEEPQMLTTPELMQSSSSESLGERNEAS